MMWNQLLCTVFELKNWLAITGGKVEDRNDPGNRDNAL